MKLIVSDLDGTLLDATGQISEKNIAAIKKAMERGVTFVVATGRTWKAALKPLEAAGVICPIICLNGAVMYDENRHELQNITIDKEECKHILSVSRKENMYVEFFTNRGIFSVSREYFLEVFVDIMKSANPHLAEEEIRSHAHRRFQMEPVEFIENYDRLFEMEELDIYTILGFSHEPDKLIRVREQLEDTAGIAITSSGDVNIEFSHADAQKGVALQNLANRLDIEMKDVMAIGDNWNDVSMLRAAGRGIAMGNASDEIKQLADAVTKPNIEDGVASAIESVLLEVEK